MRPVKNTSFRHFDIGSEWQGRLIVGLRPCEDLYYCERTYRNFDIACGGNRRQFHEGDVCCIFFAVGDDVLASERDGRPIE